MTDHFEQSAADWDKPSKVAMTNKFVDELMLNIDIRPDWKAMEIGTGTGLAGLKLLPHVKEMVLEDTSPAMLSVLQSKLTGDEPVEILEGEIFEYTRQDLDLVFSNMAFHHIEALDDALEHLAKITKKGAYVVIGDLLAEDGSFHRFKPVPHHGFDLKRLTAQFEKVGFSIRSTYIYNVLERERTPGEINAYEKFILIAQRN